MDAVLATQAAKQALLKAIPNARSDHLAVVVAFDAWVRVGEQGGRAAASAFCTDNFISHQAPPAVRLSPAPLVRRHRVLSV